MGKYKVMLEIARNQKDEFIKDWDTKEQAIGNVKVIVAYLESYEYGLVNKEDKGRYYVICDDKIIYKSKWYEIPR